MNKLVIACALALACSIAHASNCDPYVVREVTIVDPCTGELAPTALAPWVHLPTFHWSSDNPDWRVAIEDRWVQGLWLVYRRFPEQDWTIANDLPCRVIYGAYGQDIGYECPGFTRGDPTASPCWDFERGVWDLSRIVRPLGVPKLVEEPAGVILEFGVQHYSGEYHAIEPQEIEQVCWPEIWTFAQGRQEWTSNVEPTP